MSWSPLGRPVRVGLFEHDPDAFNCFRVMPRQPCQKPGAEMEIIAMVMKILDWQWEVIDTEQEFDVVNDFGNPLPDGNFSGIMGLLAEDKIDMGGLSMRITPERMKAAHFTFPIRYFQQVYIVKRPPENDFRNFIFATFTTELWMVILSTIIVVSLMRFFCALYWDSRVGTRLNIYTSSVLETFGIILKQRVQDPTAASTMLLEGFLILGMMVITQYYQTSMNSRLTAPPTSKVPFLHQNQLIDLLEKRKTYLTYYVNLTLEGSSEQNANRIDRVLRYNPIVTRSKESDLIREMKKGGVFYSTYDIEFVPQPVSSWDKKQGLTVIRDTTGIVSYVAFGFSISNRKLCQLFNKALLKILPGVPQITLGPGYGTKKPAEDINIQVKRTTLSLKRHLEQLFFIFTVSLAICIVVFIFEISSYKLDKWKKREVYNVTRSASVNYKVFEVKLNIHSNFYQIIQKIGRKNEMPDIEMKDVSAEDASESVQPFPTLNILQVVRDAQQQHGLRHGDYQRYRKYCAAKLERLRKALKFTNQHTCVRKRKAKFVKRWVSEEALKDPQFLLIGIFEAERRWALAMTEKMAMEDDEHKQRKKFSMVNSLRRAVLHATHLESLIINSSKCDAPTKLESQAYAAWMRGMCAFESRDWINASEALKLARNVYEKLADATNNTTLTNLYKAKCREIQPQLRLCEFNCADTPGAVGTMSELMEIRMQIGEGATSVDKLISEMRSSAGGAEVVTIEWGGMKSSVDVEKARAVIQGWRQADGELKQCNSPKEKMALYEKQLSDTRDAIDQISDAIRKKATENSDSTVLQSIKSYLEFLKMNGTASRYLAIIENTKSEKKVKPQDLLRLYDSVIEIYKEVAEVPGAEHDKSLIQAFAAKVEYYRAYRCFYMASSYAALNRHVEASALFERALSRVDQAANDIKKLKSNAYLSEETQEALSDLKTEIGQAKIAARTSRLTQTAGNAANTRDSQQLAKNIDTRPLVDTLDDWRDWQIKDSQREKRSIPVAKIPPTFVPMPNKPIFFDLANFHLMMPSLDDRLAQLQKDLAKSPAKSKASGAKDGQDAEQDKQGLSGMVKGWFWGKK
ncbi:unnamed protein product [Caenorhabditis auriculariae]|uniref:Signal recognition particle subunit SRP68 n=1 Tax=Caenorhabditis auriculariae TaxID=2777116 RepID=A0A8S1GUQ8_9PELO|nr:unnamed protein product [Caenorhabditis auriculariae]